MLPSEESLTALRQSDAFVWQTVREVASSLDKIFTWDVPGAEVISSSFPSLPISLISLTFLAASDGILLKKSPCSSADNLLAFRDRSGGDGGQIALANNNLRAHPSLSCSSCLATVLCSDLFFYLSWSSISLSLTHKLYIYSCLPPPLRCFHILCTMSFLTVFVVYFLFFCIFSSVVPSGILWSLFFRSRYLKFLQHLLQDLLMFSQKGTYVHLLPPTHTNIWITYTYMQTQK